MIKSKYYFEDHKSLIDEENREFKTHQEQKELSSVRCDHKGKVQGIPGGLRCSCGAMWSGPNLNILEKLLK